MRNPAWQDEELKLALELYLCKDTAWHNSASNNTWEVIALSEILQNLDIFEEDFGNDFRSTNSVRLKFANFKAVDERYKKSAMANIGKQDQKIWTEWHNEYKKLFIECKTILVNHYKGTPSVYVQDYLKRFEIEEVNENKEVYHDYISNIYSQTKELLEITQLDNSDYSKQVKNLCNSILITINPYIFDFESAPKYKEHSGINLKAIKSKNAKIGKYVQTQLKDLVTSELITPAILHNLKDRNWSKSNFHLNHPFIIDYDSTINIKDQGKDQFGYCRYWKSPFEINGKKYLVCKEWFESQRKYFDAWLDTFRLQIKSEDLKKLLQKIKKLDEKNVSILIEDLISDFSYMTNISEIINQLIKRNVLVAFQGSKREIVVEDYELLYEMINNPGEYVENE